MASLKQHSKPPLRLFYCFLDVLSWHCVLKQFGLWGERKGGEEDSVPPASLLLWQLTSAAEEMGLWSRERSWIPWRSLCTAWLPASACCERGIKWTKVSRLDTIDVCLPSTRSAAFSQTRGDVPVLVQAGPAQCGTGRTGGGPGGRQRRTDPWQEGGRIILLRRIWPLLCFGQVSAASSAPQEKT